MSTIVKAVFAALVISTAVVPAVQAMTFDVMPGEEISFEPKEPGSCTGDKCAAGGSY